MASRRAVTIWQGATLLPLAVPVQRPGGVGDQAPALLLPACQLLCSAADAGAAMTG